MDAANCDRGPARAEGGLSTFAVAEFGGEAIEADYKVANALLKAALVEDGVTLAPAADAWSEAWCGYDAPNDLFNRQ